MTRTYAIARAFLRVEEEGTVCAYFQTADRGVEFGEDGRGAVHGCSACDVDFCRFGRWRGG